MSMQAIGCIVLVLCTLYVVRNIAAPTHNRFPPSTVLAYILDKKWSTKN